MTPAEIHRQLQIAATHQRAGRLADAAAICREILSQHPLNTDALWLLSALARQQNNLDEAAELLSRWLKINPGNAEPYGMLGDIFRVQGKFEQAAQQYATVIRMKPALAAGHLNMSRALLGLGKIPESIAACRKAIELKPDWADTHEALGNALLEAGQIDDAAGSFRESLRLKPGQAGPLWSLGKILVSQNRDTEALDCYQSAVQSNPNNPHAHFFLGCRLVKARRFDDAAAEFREAIRLKPDSPDWQYQLAAITGDPTVKTAPTQYVRNLFDFYAPRFEKHLVEKLHYHIPNLLLQRVLEAAPNRQFDILDLGCGTGLCAVEFKPYARRIIGVDLSPQMIKIAASRNLYQNLITGDLMPVLNASVDQFDLILAADLLVYVGDLSQFIPAVARALRAGGIFACSIEDHPGEGFVLHHEERFAHSRSYFHNLAAAAGLKEVSTTPVTIRKQKNSEVSGWNVLISK